MDWTRHYPDLPYLDLPPVADDYGDFVHSERVLIYDGSRISVGYLQTWKDREFAPTWKLDGRDGYSIEGVTHWAPLPELPK